MEPNITNCKDETVNHLSIYLLLDLLWYQKSIYFVKGNLILLVI